MLMSISDREKGVLHECIKEASYSDDDVAEVALQLKDHVYLKDEEVANKVLTILMETRNAFNYAVVDALTSRLRKIISKEL